MTAAVKKNNIERQIERTNEFNGSLTLLINKRLELEWIDGWIKNIRNKKNKSFTMEMK
jgi:hypothetical protein